MPRMSPTKLPRSVLHRGDTHTQVAMLDVNMAFQGREMLTLTLELWQNDIFLILMLNNVTMSRIMQLILRSRSSENAHYDVARIM